MQQRADRDFATAKEVVQLVRSFRAVIAAHVLKYRTVKDSGAVAAFAAEVERDLARYKNKFRGIREPSLASFAKCAEQQINALAIRAIAQAKESGEVEIA
jgi:transposase-like protein